MKVVSVRLGVFIVCGIALSALVVNQTAQAQQRVQFAPVTIFKADRITSADPGFRYAAAAVLSPLLSSPGDLSGFTAIDTTVYKDVITTFLISKPKVGDSAQLTRLTPGQLAIAETLFTQTNVSRAKSLAVTADGISGTVVPGEIGTSADQIKQVTVQRLQAQIKIANVALTELQR